MSIVEITFSSFTFPMDSVPGGISTMAERSPLKNPIFSSSPKIGPLEKLGQWLSSESGVQGGTEIWEMMIKSGSFKVGKR